MCLKLTQSRFQKSLSNILVGKWLAWVLTRGASEERKLPAREENILVPAEPTEFFASPTRGGELHLSSTVHIRPYTYICKYYLCEYIAQAYKHTV